MRPAPADEPVSLLEDYAALRQDAAARVVARDVVVVRGPDAESYLQGQCSQDVAELPVASSADALLLSPQGKIVAYVRVTRTEGDTFWLDTDGGFGPLVRERLEHFKLRVKVELEALELACLSVRGPKTPPDSAGWSGVTHGVPFRWGTVEGIDLFGPAPLSPAEVRHAGAASWEALRVEAGIPRMGDEIDERTIAAEAGLLDRCVSFTKGCYTGQELVARLEARGNRVARHLVGLVLGGRLPAEAEPVAPIGSGAELVDPVTGKAVGAVTSSAWSPSLGAVALGYVHRDVVAPAVVEVAGGRAEVRELPLVT